MDREGDPNAAGNEAGDAPRMAGAGALGGFAAPVPKQKTKPLPVPPNTVQETQRNVLIGALVVVGVIMKGMGRR